jgi:TolB protein
METRRVLPIPAVLLLLAACSGGSAPRPHPTVRPSASLSTSGPRIVSPSPSGPPIEIGSLKGRIVLSDETNDIWSMWADGTHIRRLTSSPAQEFDPTWSPDGSRIAYRYWPEHPDISRIFVMKADGSDQRNLTRKDSWGPDWSPDGRRIVFNSLTGTGGPDVGGYAVAPDGSGLRRVSRHYVEYPAWSPDGSRIAFMAPEPGATGSNADYNIFVMDADGSHVRRLTTAPGEDGWPAWSPDGTRIVFSSARDDCSISDAPDCRTTGDIGPWEDVWIINADGTDQRRVTSEFGQFFAWSQDGSVILVAGASAMYLIRPDGSGRTPFPVEGVPTPLFPDWIA